MGIAIRLIVGLGNYGATYKSTRHNVGFWFVHAIAQQHNLTFRFEAKFKGSICKLTLDKGECWLLQPKTHMNKSGESTKALADFYQISPESILIIHDELDFAPGIIRLKSNGGHGGHNGLKSIIDHLHTNQFYRLRIGIGHPGNKDDVSNYVLNSPSKNDHERIQQAINQGLEVLPIIFAGKMDQAMQLLHVN